MLSNYYYYYFFFANYVFSLTISEIVDYISAINKCDPNPCKNGATCQQSKDDKYICICPPSFKGTLCTGQLIVNKLLFVYLINTSVFSRKQNNNIISYQTMSWKTTCRITAQFKGCLNVNPVFLGGNYAFPPI